METIKHAIGMRDQGGTTHPTPEEIGRAAWTILHTAAAEYPHRPSGEQQESMANLMDSLVRNAHAWWRISGGKILTSTFLRAESTPAGNAAMIGRTTKKPPRRPCNPARRSSSGYAPNTTASTPSWANPSLIARAFISIGRLSITKGREGRGGDEFFLFASFFPFVCDQHREVKAGNRCV